MKYQIGETIRTYREIRGLSQKQLAKKLGVSNSRVSNWEQGVNRPDADLLVRLCQALEVSADELLRMDSTTVALSLEEKELIEQYRRKPHLHHAVRILLGLERECN